jgi:vacuolar protein-sorting-associated protein 4
MGSSNSTNSRQNPADLDPANRGGDPLATVDAAAISQETADAPQRPVIQSTVGWDSSVIGQADAKHALENAFFLPRKFPSFFGSAANENRQRGILLWGPPGTGKTLIARSFARAHDAKLVEVNPADFMSKWVGDTEKQVKAVFEAAKREKTVIFMDEIDSFLRKRQEGERSHERSVKVQFILSIEDFLQNATADSCLVACTNTKSQLDTALLRRFKIHVFCGLPKLVERRATLAAFCRDLQTELTDSDLDQIATRTPFFSGSDLRRLVDHAQMGPVAELQRASHFVMNNNGKYIPSHSTVRNAQQLSLANMEPDALGPMRPIRLGDFLNGVRKSRATLTKKEYDVFLKEKSDSEEEVTTRVTEAKEEVADQFQLELRQVFTADTTRPEYLNEAQFMSNYIQVVSHGGSEVHERMNSLKMVVLLASITCAFFAPTCFWLLCALVGGVFLVNSVLLPLWLVWAVNVGGVDAVVTASAKQQLYEILLVFVFSLICDTELFQWSRFTIVNALVMMFFMVMFGQFATTLLHYAAMRCSGEAKRILATPATNPNQSSEIDNNDGFGNAVKGDGDNVDAGGGGAIGTDSNAGAASRLRQRRTPTGGGGGGNGGGVGNGGGGGDARTATASGGGTPARSSPP